MTAKVMASNGFVVPCLILRGLSLAKRESPEHIEQRQEFDTTIVMKLGPEATVNDFGAIDELTPEWEKYSDDDSGEGMPDAPDMKIEPAPEVGDNYVNVEIMLAQGDSMTRGRVINCKRNSDGNPMGNTNANPILDSQKYEVKFED